MLWIVLGIGVGFLVVERLWPAMELPKVRASWQQRRSGWRYRRRVARPPGY